MKTTTGERLKEYMRLNNCRQVDILTKCEPYCKKYNEKLGKSILSQYISGYYEPKQQKITILAEALDVSEAWLMGYDVPMERDMTADQEELMSDYDRLNQTGRDRLMAYAKELTKLYRKETSNAEEK